MGYIFSKLHNLLFASNHYKILMLGLDASGKTTILNKIKGKESVRYEGVGFHAEILFYMRLIKIISWDLGGATRMEKLLYKYYFPNTDGIIFIIDSHDKDRFDEAIEYFQDILEADELKNFPILIMANKQDLNETLSSDEISWFLKNEKYKDRKWSIIKTSGISGQGLEEGMQWMVSSIRKIKEK